MLNIFILLTLMSTIGQAMVVGGGSLGAKITWIGNNKLSEGFQAPALTAHHTHLHHLESSSSVLDSWSTTLQPCPSSTQCHTANNMDSAENPITSPSPAVQPGSSFAQPPNKETSADDFHAMDSAENPITSPSPAVQPGSSFAQPPNKETSADDFHAMDSAENPITSPSLAVQPGSSFAQPPNKEVSADDFHALLSQNHTIIPHVFNFSQEYLAPDYGITRNESEREVLNESLSEADPKSNGTIIKLEDGMFILPLTYMRVVETIGIPNQVPEKLTNNTRVTEKTTATGDQYDAYRLKRNELLEDKLTVSEKTGFVALNIELNNHTIIHYHLRARSSDRPLDHNHTHIVHGHEHDQITLEQTDSPVYSTIDSTGTNETIEIDEYAESIVANITKNETLHIEEKILDLNQETSDKPEINVSPEKFYVFGPAGLAEISAENIDPFLQDKNYDYEDESDEDEYVYNDNYIKVNSSAFPQY